MVAAAQPEATRQSIPSADEPIAAEGELHVIDVPEVAQVAHHAPQDSGKDPDDLICKRIKTTGSHRVTRVCMTRGEIEKRRAEHQAMMKKLGRTPDGVNRERRPERTSRMD